MTDKMREQLVAYLKDAHALEQMSLTMTAASAKTTRDPVLRALFEHHHEETEEHESLIRQRVEAYGEKTSTLKDIGARVTALAKGAAALVPGDTPGRLARDGYVQEHTEIAAYELLRRVAERAGDRETADVAQRILENERETADKLAATWDHVADLSLRAAGEAPSTGRGGAEAAGTTGNPAAGAGVEPRGGTYEDEGVGRREDVER